MRADVFLYKNGIAKSRTSAQSLITGGVLFRGTLIEKPSFDLPDDADTSDIEVLNPERYVGRGGLKLEKAIDSFGLDVNGIVAIDLGASTGGFTDCLLQHGASKVYAVDVGHDQLDSRLLQNPKVVNMQGTDARTINPDMFSEPISFICSDLSFISQTKVFSAVYDTLTDNGIFVSLIKPQFEAGHINTKNGVIKDKNIHYKVVNEVIDKAQTSKLFAEQFTTSPIKGGDGNKEFLVLFRKNGSRKVTEAFIKKQ